MVRRHKMRDMVVVISCPIKHVRRGSETSQYMGDVPAYSAGHFLQLTNVALGVIHRDNKAYSQAEGRRGPFDRETASAEVSVAAGSLNAAWT